MSLSQQNAKQKAKSTGACRKHLLSSQALGLSFKQTNPHLDPCVEFVYIIDTKGGVYIGQKQSHIGRNNKISPNSYWCVHKTNKLQVESEKK